MLRTPRYHLCCLGVATLAHLDLSNRSRRLAVPPYALRMRRRFRRAASGRLPAWLAPGSTSPRLSIARLRGTTPLHSVYSNFGLNVARRKKTVNWTPELD